MSFSERSSFGKIRAYLWPIHAYEIKKLAPMIVILSAVAFAYSILRNLKDALVVTAEGSGAEAIPFIKLWVMFPSAVGAAMLLSSLLNKFSRAKVFLGVVLSFTLFFVAFALFIYPNRESLHPHHTADLLESILPLGCKGLVAVFRNWTLTCFYVVSELWGALVLQVLVWGIANEITKSHEAPRFYSVMTIASGVASLLAGQCAASLSQPSNIGLSTIEAWESSLTHILLLVASTNMIVLLAFKWLERNILVNPIYLPQKDESVKKEEKKLSFKESLRCIALSKHLLLIGALVISYNLVINLVEVIWKDQVKQLYPATSDFNIYVNNLTSIMGIVSIFTSIILVGGIQKLGWTKAALIAPIVALVTSAAFFGSLFSTNLFLPLALTVTQTTPLALATFFGSMQNCFTKAAKYTVFDATKEMAFIPLEKEERIQGKVAIDGIGPKVAKSLSSVIHQGFLLVFGTLPASAPFVSIVVLTAITLWIVAVSLLGKRFLQKESSTEAVVYTSVT